MLSSMHNNNEFFLFITVNLSFSLIIPELAGGETKILNIQINEKIITKLQRLFLERRSGGNYKRERTIFTQLLSFRRYFSSTH